MMPWPRDCRLSSNSDKLKTATRYFSDIPITLSLPLTPDRALILFA